MKGLWDRLIGQRAKTQKQNEMEALWALRRDQDQRQAVITAQLQERQALQDEIKATRARHAQTLREIHFDATNYRLMTRGQEPKARPSFEQAKPASLQPPKDQDRLRLDQLREKKPEAAQQKDRTQERLRRLRENRRDTPDKGPEPER